MRSQYLGHVICLDQSEACIRPAASLSMKSHVYNIIMNYRPNNEIFPRLWLRCELWLRMVSVLFVISRIKSSRSFLAFPIISISLSSFKIDWRWASENSISKKVVTIYVWIDQTLKNSQCLCPTHYTGCNKQSNEHACFDSLFNSVSQGND